MERILVVDDEMSCRLIYSEELMEQGYEVFLAANGREALEVVEKIPIDLVLLDIKMPEMDGYEVCKNFQEKVHLKDIPIIFISAYGSCEEVLRLGAADYVTKSCYIGEVVARVKSHLTISSLKNELADKNKELQIANNILEQRVKERTNELTELNAIYERFVPREILSLLKKKNIFEVGLGNQIKSKMTVMFCDIQGWTTLSENMSPQENFNFINTFLKWINPVITEHHGFINQFLGDGFMALFPGSVDDGVEASISLHTAISAFNLQRQSKAFQPIAIGVGLHMGDLMLGIIGNEDRMQGTVISDVVNSAARLEGLTRIYGSSISISESILASLKDRRKYNYRFVDKVRLKGKNNPVTVYEIFDGDPPEVIRLKIETKTNFEEGIRLYYDRKFDKASVKFTAVLKKNPDDMAAQIYLTRSGNYIVSGVSQEWTGIENLTIK